MRQNNLLDMPITYRNRPPMLEELNLDYIFKDIHGFTPAWDIIFRCMMLRRYGGFRIGCKSPARFKLWLEDRFYSVWQRYSRLYNSLDVFHNPFINEMIAREKNTKGLARNSQMTNAQERHDANAINVGTTTGQGATQQDQASKGYNSGRAQNIGQNSASTKASGQTHAQGTVDTKFADTPQTPQETGGSGVGADPEPQPWNSDYLTTHTLETSIEDTKNQSNTGSDSVSESDSRSDNLEGAWQNAVGKTYNLGTSQAKNTNQASGMRNTENEAVYGRRFSEGEVNQGLRGLSLSAALMEWRETFLPVDNLLLNEFESLFYGILDYND